MTGNTGAQASKEEACIIYSVMTRQASVEKRRHQENAVFTFRAFFTFGK